ncbi:MAG: hypothetical protein IPM88_10840 [Nitrospira sp.]|nr:hypothetical protein [Nitrospira sp.]
MNDFQIPTEQQPPRRSWIFPALLLIAGVLIGVILTSDLGWLPTGHAVPEPVPPPVATPVSTAVQPTLPGAGGQSFVDVAKVVKPAVVNIFATRNGSSEEGRAPRLRIHFLDDFSAKNG